MKRRLVVILGLICLVAVLIVLIRPGLVRHFWPNIGGLATSDQSSIDLTLASGSYSRTVAGKERTFDLYVPSAVKEGTGPVDVLFVFHGTGGTGEGIRDVGFDPYADEAGFVVVYPDSLSRDGVPKWDPTNSRDKDVDFIKAIVADIDTALGDRYRDLYVAGMSNGSVMAQSIGCFVGDIDGVAGVSAAIGSQLLPYCERTSPLPFIGFYGTEDRFGEIEKFEGIVDYFAEKNACLAFDEVTLPDVDPTDDTTVELRTYINVTGEPCDAPVHYYRINGGGHFWPGGDNYRPDRLERNEGHVTQDIDATKLIVEFFGLNN